MRARNTPPTSPDASGSTPWRSLREHAGDPAFQAALEREFPEGATEPLVQLGRRGFMKWMGASLGLAGLAACRRPEELILPYSRAPEAVLPGRPLHFATALPLLGTAFGVLAESHEGRPTKLEGHPDHPDSLGATSPFVQAAILDLYDPDRSPGPSEGREMRPWAEAERAMLALGADLRRSGGRGFAVLTGEHRSPTVTRLLAALREAAPEISVVAYEPLDQEAAREGAALAFGRALDTRWVLDAARVVLALDADLFATDGSPVRQARAFAAARRPDDQGSIPQRLYAVESRFSLTGAAADHRLALQSARGPGFLHDLAGAVLGELSRARPTPDRARARARARARDQGRDQGRDGQGVGVEALRSALVAGAPARPDRAPGEARFVAALARDLVEAGPGALVAVGRIQPAETHALAALLNHALGATGVTSVHHAPLPASEARGAAAVAALAEAVRGGSIHTILVLGSNPALTAPADARFAEAAARARAVVHLGTHRDETAALARWHLPEAHPLESWGDVLAADGTAAIIQPLIAPLFGGVTTAEVLALLLGAPERAHALVQETWSVHLGAGQAAWRAALQTGQVPGTHATAVEVAPRADLSGLRDRLARAAATDRGQGLEVTFHPDPHALDGRFANNAWLQELPDPMTKLTWGNAALLAPATAAELGVSDGDLLEIAAAGRAVILPALVAPGQAPGSIALTLGQGRTRAGQTGSGVGVDVYPLRTSAAPFIVTGASARRVPGRAELARTQEHFALEGRPLAREVKRAEFERDPEIVARMVEHPPLVSLFEEHRYEGHAWGMAIDLDACVGCNACAVACQAENNIPVVGTDGVRRSREMNWIRIDRYFAGDPAAPISIAQPVLCQHCENAPCEQVCPVGATTHSPEGLNEMTYNRCIGTKYCGNNCPYKVRRFNFFDYTRALSEPRRMQFNPDVTVRSRGVMEKCSFCVQRINRAKLEAKLASASPPAGAPRAAGLADGAVVTACEAACPTRAITFGDLNDAASRVAARARGPRAYHLLEELNVKPRVSYLARVRNPNPALEGA